MIRDRKITFRVSDDEYKQIYESKGEFKSISEYIRGLIFDES